MAETQKCKTVRYSWGKRQHIHDWKLWKAWPSYCKL